MAPRGAWRSTAANILKNTTHSYTIQLLLVPAHAGNPRNEVARLVARGLINREVDTSAAGTYYQVIVIVCATVAAVRSNVGTMGPNYGGASQQAQQGQQQPPPPFQYHPSLYPPPLPYPFAYPPSPYQLGRYQPEMCPPQPCQPQQPHHHGLAGHMAFVPNGDGGFFFHDPRSSADPGHYQPPAGERDPNEPAFMSLGRSNSAGAHGGSGVRTRRHALFSGQHAKH
ncbi:hypothetical protein HPB50_029606 [Hyalomma asiaticum]|nr:hypothetical protein HPB50_029606 [Hyalomma asiaticum]